MDRSFWYSQESWTIRDYRCTPESDTAVDTPKASTRLKGAFFDHIIFRQFPAPTHLGVNTVCFSISRTRVDLLLQRFSAVYRRAWLSTLTVSAQSALTSGIFRDGETIILTG